MEPIYKECCSCFDEKQVTGNAIDCCKSGFMCNECINQYTLKNGKKLKTGRDNDYDFYVIIKCFVCRKKNKQYCLL